MVKRDTHDNSICNSCGYNTVDLPDPHCCPECGNDPSEPKIKEARWALILNRFGCSIALGTLITQLILVFINKDWLYKTLLREKPYYNTDFHQQVLWPHDQRTMLIALALGLFIFLPTSSDVRSRRSYFLLTMIILIATISFMAETWV